MKTVARVGQWATRNSARQAAAAASASAAASAAQCRRSASSLLLRTFSSNAAPDSTPGLAWSPRSSYKNSQLSESDRAARLASFERRVAQEAALRDAHTNCSNSNTEPTGRFVQVAIDCAYESTRNTPVLGFSLASQIRHCIGANRNAERPVKLHLLQWPSLAGECMWPHVYDSAFHRVSTPPPVAPPVSDEYRAALAASLRLPSDQPCPLGLDALTRGILMTDARFNNPTSPSRRPSRLWRCVVDSRRLEEVFQPARLLYLTPDSPNLLLRVDTEHVYVIGGLVDRTVVSGVSFARAQRIGAATARLPVRECLGQHVAKSASLNVDTVFRVLLDASSLQRKLVANHPQPTEEQLMQCWRDAFQMHLPSRYRRHNTSRAERMQLKEAQSAAANGTSPSASSAHPPAPHSAIMLQCRMRSHDKRWLFLTGRPGCHIPAEGESDDAK